MECGKRAGKLKTQPNNTMNSSKCQQNNAALIKMGGLRVFFSTKSHLSFILIKKVKHFESELLIPKIPHVLPVHQVYEFKRSGYISASPSLAASCCQYIQCCISNSKVERYGASPFCRFFYRRAARNGWEFERLDNLFTNENYDDKLIDFSKVVVLPEDTAVLRQLSETKEPNMLGLPNFPTIETLSRWGILPHGTTEKSDSVSQVSLPYTQQYVTKVRSFGRAKTTQPILPSVQGGILPKPCHIQPKSPVLLELERIFTGFYTTHTPCLNSEEIFITESEALSICFTVTRRTWKPESKRFYV